MGLTEGEPIELSLKELFITETLEQLDNIVEILLTLERNPEEQGDVIHKLFRFAHNIKGSASMMGLKDLKETMHIVENMLDGVRKGQTYLDPEMIDSLIQFSDVVKAYVSGQQWKRTGSLLHWKDIFDSSVSELSETKSNTKKEVSLMLSDQEKLEIAAWQEEGKTVYGIEVQFVLNSEMQGASALIFVKHLSEFGKVYKTAPSEDLFKEGNFTQLKVVLFIQEAFSAEQEAAIVAYPLYDSESINIRKWIYRPEESEFETPAAEYQYEQTIRVDSFKIDKLINNVEEILAVKAGLQQLYHQRSPDIKTWNHVGKLIQKLEQIAGILQVEVLDLRMIPVRQIFLRFPKIIRDIAKQSGKMVEINFFGEETEIDKQIAERLIDPLTHVIRNAVDHGLEDGERRKFIDKPETGKITLGAAQEGDYIIISVGDDGKGLDLEKIRDKGVKQGLVKKGAQLSKDEIVNLIFLPGFSTADQVSDISGRGVGLDIVYNSIKALKGDVEIETQTNQGTTFRLKVPLTLAIIQSFLVKVSGQTFGIPSAEVVESLSVDIDSFHKFSDKMVYSLRQEVITVVDLCDMFGFAKTVNSSKTPLIIVKYGRYKLGLIVEELIDQEEIMIKQINKALAENPLISGAAILGNGDIALILNINEIIKKAIG